MDTNKLLDMLNQAVQPEEHSRGWSNNRSTLLHHLDKNDDVFETCKQVLYAFRPYNSSGNATGIRIPDSFQVSDDDRSFTLEFLKDCCLLFNIDENQAWNTYEKFIRTLPKKEGRLYDHLELYKLKSAALKLKDASSHKKLDYQTITQFLKSFRYISSSGASSFGATDGARRDWAVNGSFSHGNGVDQSASAIMNGRSPFVIINVLEQIVRVAWDAALKKTLGQQLKPNTIQALSSRNALNFLYQPSSISSLSSEHKSDYLKVKAALDNENYGLEILQTHYKARYGAEQTVEDFDTICQVGVTMYGHFNNQAFNCAIKFGKFYFSLRSSLLDIIMFAFNRYALIIYDMVPSHPINSPIAKLVNTLMKDWVGIRLLVQLAQYQYNNSDYSSNTYSDNVNELPGTSVGGKNTMSSFVQRYQWLSGFVEDTALGVSPTMWGKAPGNATPKDVFKHPFFCSQKDGHFSDNLRVKTFKSVWQTQICLEENKLTEAFTMYLYISRANIDESDFMEGFYEIIKAYMYLSVSSGALENVSTNSNSGHEIHENYNENVNYGHQTVERNLKQLYFDHPQQKTRLLNNLAILLCLQPERDDIYETHKHILFSSGAASARETQTVLEQQRIGLGGAKNGQIKRTETLEIFEYFKGLCTQKNLSGERDFLLLVWNSFIASTVEDHFKDKDTGEIISPCENNDYKTIEIVEQMLASAQQVSQDKYESGITWAHNLLYLLQHDPIATNYRNKNTVNIVHLCLSSGLEGIVRAFPNILTKKNTLQQWLGILKFVVKGVPHQADQICKALHENGVRRSYLASILLRSSKYVGNICQLQMQSRQQSRDKSHNTIADVDNDFIFHEHLGVLGNICNSDHFASGSHRDVNTPTLNLSVVDEENKLSVCKQVDHSMWLNIYHCIQKASFMSSSGKKLDKIKILKLTNVLNFVCSSHPYSFSELITVGEAEFVHGSTSYNSSAEIKETKIGETECGEIFVTYVLKIFNYVTSSDINEVFQMLNRDQYVESLLTLQCVLLRYMKKLYGVHPDLFTVALKRDDKFFSSLARVKQFGCRFCVYDALFEAFRFLQDCVNHLVRNSCIIDLEKQFRHIDKNNDRLISRQEFKDALKEAPYMLNLSSGALQKLLKRFDQNGDGNVDYGEFVQFVFDMESTNSEKTSSSSVYSDIRPTGSAKDNDEDLRVETEIRRVLQILAGRTPNILGGYQYILSKILRFTFNILSESNEWAYTSQLHRLVMIKNVFDILKSLLSENDRIYPTDKMSTKENLIDSILRDRIIQKRLLESVTYLSTSCIDTDLSVQKCILPVDFTRSNGAINSTENSLELDYVEKNTENGLKIILAVLNFKPRLQYGAFDAIRNSKLKISMLMQRIFTTSDAKLSTAMSTASDVGSRAFPKQSFNQLVAIASYITYNCHRNTCIPVLATKILSTVATIVAISREPGNLFGRGGLNAKYNGTSTEMTQNTSLNSCHTSLIAFFDNEKYAFSKSIVGGLRESGIMTGDRRGPSSFESRNSVELQSEIISFICVCVDKQPAMAGLLLSETETVTSLQRILSQVSTCSKNQPKILSRVLALLSSLWHARSSGQFKSIVDKFRGSGDGNNKRSAQEFWTNVTYPLFIPLNKVRSQRASDDINGNMGDVLESPPDYERFEEIENFCYQLDIRSFALQLFGLELYTGESASVMEEIKQKIIGKNGTTSESVSTLHMWFTSFCCFDFKQNLIKSLNTKALNLGIDLRAFKNKHGNKQAGRRTYGISYIYNLGEIKDMLSSMYTKVPLTDAGRIHNISSNDICISESVGRAEKDKFIDVLYECNLMCSNTDAQLLLLKSCRRFIESYCLSGSLRSKNYEPSKGDESELQRRGTITLKKSNSLGSNASNASSAKQNSLFIGDATSFQMLGVLSARLREIHQPEIAVSKAAYELSEMFLSMVFHQLYDDNFILRPQTLDASKSMELLSNINRNVEMQLGEGFCAGRK